MASSRSSYSLLVVFFVLSTFAFPQNNTNKTTKVSTPPPAPRVAAPARPAAAARPAAPTRPAVAARPGTPTRPTTTATGNPGNRVNPPTRPTSPSPVTHPTASAHAAGPAVPDRERGGKTAAVGAKPGSFQAPAKKTVQFARNGVNGTATVDSRGKPRTIEAKGIRIEHPIAGGRRIVTTKNGVTAVSTGASRGYIQRAYTVRNGHTYVQRTYVVNNVTYTHVYREYVYRGVSYYGYYPAYYYHPVFYGWVYNPWAAPVYYTWGWGPSPWYGYYGGYFAPYPVYPTASLWLTDYLLAANLQAAYDARNESNAPPDQSAQQTPGPAAPTPLSPEVKQAIAEEVKRQIEAERQSSQPQQGSAPAANPAPDANSATPPALLQRTYIVSNTLDLSNNGQECSLTPGDVLTRIGEPDNDQQVNVLVTSAKQNDCSTGTQGSIALNDLQEMHNHFCEQIDGGLKTLAEKQGHDGLPAAPDTQTLASEVPPPPPESDAIGKLQGQQKEADEMDTAVWNMTHAGTS